jgi:hypothetical protein
MRRREFTTLRGGDMATLCGQTVQEMKIAEFRQ